MKPNPDISIIVPVYNVEKYLVRCLDSLFNQQFSGSFQVIAVEDFSTDNSLQILKIYKEKTPGLIVIEHGVNKKLSVARVTGMKVAKGKYIMHVDSDDWLLPNAFENLFRECEESDADIIAFNYVRIDSNGNRVEVNNIRKQLITSDKLKIQHHFFGAPWNKIVKRSLVENMISGQVGINNTEDLLYASEILLKAEKICLLPACYYVYFVNTHSLTGIIKPQPYFKSQQVILLQLQKILSNYSASKKFSSNIIDYLEKFIYLELTKTHFWYKENLAESDKLIRELFSFSILNKSRIKSFELALKNRFFCLFQVKKRFGVRMAIGIILKSFKY